MTGSPAPRLRILVVDDEDANLLFLEKALSRKGHQVILAHGGEEALALYERIHPDLVLMDVMMPGWDGFETTRRIRAGGGSGTRWVPLIFLSAVGRTPDMVKALAAGGDDYLVKPVDLALLESKIAVMQRIALLQRELESHVQELARIQAGAEQQRQTAVKIFGRLMRLDGTPHRHVQFRVLPSDTFSGDLVSVAEGPDGGIYLMLADASGHGLVAAAAILPLVNHFQIRSERGHSLAHIARSMNQLLHDLLPSQHFVAALLVRADPARGLVEVLNAGMPAAHWLDPAGEPRREFPSRHLPFGLQASGADSYRPEVNRIPPGHQILLCSDGLTEAGIDTGAPFGIDSVIAAARSARAPDSRLAAVLAAYDQHRAGRDPGDDVSLSILTIPEWQPADPVPPISSTESGSAGAPALSLRLEPPQLQNPDLLPNLIHFLAETRLLPENGKSRVFAVLKELLSNALDYGLLGLDSRHRVCADELLWQDWQQERRRRLEGLASGSIDLRIGSLTAAGSGVLRIEVVDSGPGFDVLSPPPGDGGLSRVRRLTGALPIFHDRGNAVVADIPY